MHLNRGMVNISAEDWRVSFSAPSRHSFKISTAVLGIYFPRHLPLLHRVSI